MLRQCKRAPTRTLISGWLNQGRSRSFASGGTPWIERVPFEKVQIYASTSNNPYLNLSIEHFLLQNSPPDSVILFTYINRPCVVIGRNQNPWLEVNLNLIGKPFHHQGLNGPESERHVFIDLIRRRSGGGTVFHDQGNVNWAVICPPSVFTRDKHCEMVVRALRTCGIERARVNERHDIVLDQGQRSGVHNTDDMHQTPFTITDADGPRPLKVSGSAYKLTRTRALHHATMLLSSPNLAVIPQILRSPAKHFIVAKGVDSVSSPVANIGLDHSVFLEALTKQFNSIYNDKGAQSSKSIGADVTQDAKIAALVDEMKTNDWLYGQTPHFTFDSRRYSEKDDTLAAKDADLPLGSRIVIESRHGKIQNMAISVSPKPAVAESQASAIEKRLTGSYLYKIGRWGSVLKDLPLGVATCEVEQVATFLDDTLPPSAGGR